MSETDQTQRIAVTEHTHGTFLVTLTPAQADEAFRLSDKDPMVGCADVLAELIADALLPVNLD